MKNYKKHYKNMKNYSLRKWLKDKATIAVLALQTFLKRE